MNVVRSSPAHG